MLLPSSLTFSPAFGCKLEHVRIYYVFRPHPSSTYFEYACGGFGCQALYLQPSSLFRYEAGERVELDGMESSSAPGPDGETPVRPDLCRHGCAAGHGGLGGRPFRGAFGRFATPASAPAAAVARFIERASLDAIDFV